MNRQEKEYISEYDLFEQVFIDFHQKFPVWKIDNAYHAQDQCQSHGYQGIYSPISRPLNTVWRNIAMSIVQEILFFKPVEEVVLPMSDGK